MQYQTDPGTMTRSMTMPLLPVPRPYYSGARENLVRAIPHRLLCALACGGLNCRYEGPACWRSNQQAILGLFSSWVTDDIVAMTRPSTHLIAKFNIIQQFHRLKIKSIINMQLPGEHLHCGPEQHPESGFTYSPQVFMENDIYFYNFGMPDYGVNSLVNLIDGVKVLSFAVKEGRVAIHCHAGLGRTGVLIACYLIYTLRISASEAVHYVRIKRPRSIQTRAQISQVFDFARLLVTQLTQYPDINLRHGDAFTLQHYLNRQTLLLHGQELRTLRHTPKLVYLLCVRLSCLALGLTSPPEIIAELARRSTVRMLGQTVRETLFSKQYMSLSKDVERMRSGSVSSWDKPVGLLERKGGAKLYKRSYSDSDLSSTTNKQLNPGAYYIPAMGDKRDWCGQDLIRADLRPVSPCLISSSLKGVTVSFKLAEESSASKKETLTPKKPADGTNRVKRTKNNTAKKAPLMSKFNSIAEMYGNKTNLGATLLALSIARAMADTDPPGEAILQKTALLQDEMNSSECGWALLVTETDPQVLSHLLWTWLEKLKEPILRREDIQMLISAADNPYPLNVLKKCQRHTISCLLSCVGMVTSLCPHKEDPVLQRMMRALTRHHQEEMESLTALIKIFKSCFRYTLHN